MNLKQKIALSELKRQVDRGIVSEEKSKELFEQITGRSADDVPVEGKDDELIEQIDAISNQLPEKKSDPQISQEEVKNLNPEAHQDRIDKVRVSGQSELK